MYLQRPSCTIDVTHQSTGVFERGGVLGEVERLRARAAEPNRGRHTSRTSAVGVIRDQSAISTRKGRDCRPGALESLPEYRRRHLERGRRLWTRHFEDLAEHVREPVLAIQTLQHAERASYLHFLDEYRTFSLVRSLRREPLRQILGKSFKAQMQLFDGTLFHVQDVVDADAIDPRPEASSRFQSMRMTRP